MSLTPEQESDRIHDVVVRICQACIDLNGEMCHEPNCVFCRRTMGEVEELLDKMLICPIIDDERYVLAGDAVAEYQETPLRSITDEMVDVLIGLGNASYTELRPLVETNQEYFHGPDEFCSWCASEGLKFRHFKTYATPLQWAIAERVSGWFQGQIAPIVDHLIAEKDAKIRRSE